jgi:hypothetical protein
MHDNLVSLLLISLLRCFLRLAADSFGEFQNFDADMETEFELVCAMIMMVAGTTVNTAY